MNSTSVTDHGDIRRATGELHMPPSRLLPRLTSCGSHKFARRLEGSGAPEVAAEWDKTGDVVVGIG